MNKASGFSGGAIGLSALCLLCVGTRGAAETDFVSGTELLLENSDFVQADVDPFIVWSASPHILNVGSATSQGDAVVNADDVRSMYGINGAGINIGVISDSFNASGSIPTVASQISAGDLPGIGNPNGFVTPVNVVNDDISGTDEGRAMLEIVHDLAPGANLMFHSAFNNGFPSTESPDFTIGEAIDNLVAAGADVIVDDVGILTAPRFQDGYAAQAVNRAFDAGVAYFSAAGNSDTEATRQMFNGGVGGVQNFDLNANEGGDIFLDVNVSGTGLFSLQWDDSYDTVGGSGATADFQLNIITGGGTIAINDNGIGDEAFEFGGVTGTGTLGLQIQHISGDTSKLVQLSVFGGATIADDDDTNTGTIFGHAAATGGQAIAAMFHSDPGLDDVESFSSIGPTDIFFDEDGNPIMEVRDTPSLTAPDGVSTTTSGFASFFGTSAAAPHAAAVALLMLQQAMELGITLNPTQVYEILQMTATDIETPGYDNLSGYGLINALSAVNAVRAIPEPTTLLAMAGLGGLVVMRRRAA